MTDAWEIDGHAVVFHLEDYGLMWKLVCPHVGKTRWSKIRTPLCRREVDEDGKRIPGAYPNCLIIEHIANEYAVGVEGWSPSGAVEDLFDIQHHEELVLSGPIPVGYRWHDSGQPALRPVALIRREQVRRLG